ncbi:hypothetical protein GCM10020358_69470 [Amorphoplanes nipponensis]|uniref:Uncharacterized protein n=1 Tax=Actinoplanes nipponensis TaxID=135950 RepID=A0A919JG73_9ACTN|nr:hypothetical protein [Actinoplanes nipponensis]GIE49073.1 hypothetical protein Ani05nite_26070 [Actinoplanes nipponensis]
MTATPRTEPPQTRQSVADITAFLQSAVWDLAYGDDVPPEEALQLHHAAQLMLSASEQLVRAGLSGAAAPAGAGGPADPPALTRLLLALVAFTRLDPLERGRLAPELARAARSTLRRERAEALRLTGWAVADLAREYDISPGAVRAAMMEDPAP